MNYDEFAFFNHQLAAMLRDGIPLEGALKQLCTGMKAGPLRTEFEQLERDLSRGVPLKEAMGRRTLPEFYRRMVEIGVRGNDLPGLLTLVADHYQRTNALWTRLKGLLVYPFLVVLVSLGVTFLLSSALARFMALVSNDLVVTTPLLAAVSVWIPPAFLGIMALVAVGVLSWPTWRAWLRWRVPPFREASLAQLASVIALTLKQGATLAEALALAETLEAGTPAAKVLAEWRTLVESGQGKPVQWPSAGLFPTLFLWLVQRAGEDVTTGFQKAAEIYQGRAAYRIEMALYGVLPVSVLFLGQMIFWQSFPLIRSLISMMNWMGDMGGDGLKI
jgi:type IV pilus assembly protein PilC